MTTFGERLREERARLGMSQTQFGVLAGVQKRAQIHYESDERVPDATYLAALAQAGVDVLYVITGNRAGGTAGTTRGAIDAERLLDMYDVVEFVAKKAHKRWGERRKIELAVKGYNMTAGDEEQAPEQEGEAHYAKVVNLFERS